MNSVESFIEKLFKITNEADRRVSIIAGSILTGLSLLAEMINEWLHHFFYAAFNIAKGTMLKEGSFDPKPYYEGPEAVQIFIGTRIIIWIFIAIGVILLIRGLREPR